MTDNAPQALPDPIPGQTKTVGRFTMDYANGVIKGPAEFMREEGNALLEAIAEGQDTYFLSVAHLSPDIETAILVYLQTKYAGWKGMKQVESWLGPKGN